MKRQRRGISFRGATELCQGHTCASSLLSSERAAVALGYPAILDSGLAVGRPAPLQLTLTIRERFFISDSTLKVSFVVDTEMNALSPLLSVYTKNLYKR
ncbi:hypothetical protein CDAR_571631 [Caerostris darwini]|uniref:Uncharacterized protein n=1 Tax=Caerostris darwini TaxID=1538125 RepID=A0AAV4WDL6_9ARAC|nr:hypothetical protein CDAR_571631 [Caerostris darwini]